MSVVEDHRTAQEVVADLRAAGARETTSVEVEAAEAAFTAWEAEMASSPAPGRDPVLCAMLSAGVPEEWATQLTQTVHACALAAVPTGVRAESLDAPQIREQASAVLGVVETLTATTASLEAMTLSATRDLTALTGQVLLAKKGLSSPDELASSARDQWRARAKSATRGEIRAAIGWGEGEVSDLVALANMPPAVLDPVRTALSSGEAPWRLVRRFFRECAELPHEAAAAVANGFFGTDPAAAVTERLGSDGMFTGQPWVHKQFYRALDREVARVKEDLRQDDPAGKARTRAESLAASDLWVRLDDDGTASLGLRCSATQGAALADRIDLAARRARGGGDPRSLNVLRATIGVALLLHGTLPEPPPTSGANPGAGVIARKDAAAVPEESARASSTQSAAAVPQEGASARSTQSAAAVPEEGAGSEPIDIERTAQLDRVLAGLPAATINILVPFSTLLPNVHPTLGDSTTTDHPSWEVGPAPPGREPLGAPPGRESPGAPPGPEPVGTVRSGVGEVTGKHPHFLTGAQIRALALQPGTTIFRILTDAATGRYVERSTTAYRFDKAMRTHIAFADQTCRAPNCTVPAAQCQFDHVQEFGTPGGETSEANGALLHGVDHQRKTEKLWDAIIHPNRDMTWTSLLGRIYRTKTHDYNQYTALLRMATDQVAAAPVDQRAAVIDEAMYAALAYRPPGSSLEAEDDWAWDEPEVYPAWGLVSLSHRDRHGRRQPGPHPAVVATEREHARQAAGRADDQHTTPPESNTQPDSSDAPPPF